AISAALQPYFTNDISYTAALQFSNLFFTITGFHGFHVTVGIILNIIILCMVLNNTFEKRGSYLMIEKVGLYWHFVDLVWVFVFTFFYLI
ncbi:MAG: cytochrome oxidase subunit III, partial [Flavobacteriales bacterium]